MRRSVSALCVAIVVGSGTAAAAQQRPATRTLTCAAIRALVDRDGQAELASSETAFEMIHRDAGSCVNDETSAPAYEPSADEPSCFAGWRCKQRNSDSNAK